MTAPLPARTPPRHTANMKKRSYEDILKALPPRGRVNSGEVEITNISGTEDNGPFGVIYSDRYVTLVRDPVTFPNYTLGGHVRMFEGDPTRRRCAIVVIPMRPNADGGFDVGWVRQWRHPLDGWTTEVPRGLCMPDETVEQGALRELREETGLRNPALMVYLGDMANNTGNSCVISAYYAAVFLGHARMIQREKNETEAISNVIWAPFKDWRKVIATPGAPDRPVAPMDLFTAGAFGLAFMTGYLTRLQSSWGNLYKGQHLNDERVDAVLRRRIEEGEDAPDIIVRLAAPEYLPHFERELPMIGIERIEDEEAAFRVRNTPLLTLVWLLSTSAVTAIEPTE